MKGYDSTPIDFRIIGCIEKSDLDKISSSSEGLQVKDNKPSFGTKFLNITIEGLGDDFGGKETRFLTLFDYGLHPNNAKQANLRDLLSSPQTHVQSHDAYILRVCFDLGETNNNVISTVGKKSMVICFT